MLLRASFASQEIFLRAPKKETARARAQAESTTFGEFGLDGDQSRVVGAECESADGIDAGKGLERSFSA